MRSQGFAKGDIDTSFPLDDKFLRLQRAVSLERYYAASGVYFHVVAATWREAERKAGGKVCPGAEEAIADLQSVGLLDVEACVPRRAWTHAVAQARRNRRTAADRQRRHRDQMSRVTNGDARVTNGDSVGNARTVGTVGNGGVQGGRIVHDDRDDVPVEDVDGYDQVLDWMGSQKAWVDSPKMKTDLARMVDRDGVPAVLSAMKRLLEEGNNEAAQLIYGTRNRLHPLPGSKVAEAPGPSADEIAAFAAEKVATRRRKAHDA